MLVRNLHIIRYKDEGSMIDSQLEIKEKSRELGSKKGINITRKKEKKGEPRSRRHQWPYIGNQNKALLLSNNKAAADTN